MLICFSPQNPGLADQYLSVILSLEQSHTHLGMLGVLVDFCTAHKDMATVNKHKVSNTDWDRRTGLTSRRSALQGWKEGSLHSSDIQS